jgi:hypothetical protein
MPLWIAYFPGRDGVMGKAYGPFAAEEVAARYARTLSVDPDEGKVAELVLEEPIERAERRIEAIRESWPHAPGA